MQGMLFWSGHIVHDVAFLVLTLGLLLVGLVTYRTPGLVRMIAESLFYRRELLFFAQLRRSIPCWLFRFVGRGLSALLLALITFFLLDREDLLIQFSPREMVGVYLALFTFFALFFWIRRLAYRFLGWVYLSRDTYKEWVSCYALLEWIWSLPLYIAIILQFRDETFWYGVGLAAGTFLLWRIILLWRTISLLTGQKVSYLLLSLYLCGHEVVPFVLLFGIPFWG